MVSNNIYKLKSNEKKKKVCFEATRCYRQHCQVGLKVYVFYSNKALIFEWYVVM